MNIKVKRTPYIKEEYYTLDFWFDNSSSYTFGCSKDGVVLKDKNTPQALKNYHWCVSHPEKFIRKSICKHTQMLGGNLIGHCTCGCNFEMYDEYLGSCECPNCGTWYNLAGQEVLSPYQYNADEG